MEQTIISKRLSNILINLGIHSIVTWDMSYIDCDVDDEKFITFTPTNKINEIKIKGDDVWSSKRNKIKIGRFFKDILYVNDETVENLVNQYKTYYKIEMGNIEDIFEIVDGNDIWDCYQKENYSPGGGSLGGSCMTNASKNKLKLYTDNPKTIKLLIIKNNDKITGRALIWTTNNGVYLDRAYCRYDKDIYLFSLYADKMKFSHYYKNRIDYKEVKLSKPHNGELPYLDTFKNLNKKKITN